MRSRTISMHYVSHMNALCVIYECIVCHIWMHCVSHMNESCVTYMGDSYHRDVCVKMCRVTQLKVLLTWLIHMCDTWLTHLHIWVIHIIDLLEPRDTHTNESHVTHMNESCHRPPRAAHSRTIATAGRDSTRIQPPARAPAFSTAVFIRSKSPIKSAKEPYKPYRNQTASSRSCI